MLFIYRLIKDLKRLHCFLKCIFLMQASLLKNIVDFSRSLLGNKGEIFFVCSNHVSENIVDFSGSLLGKKGGYFCL